MWRGTSLPLTYCCVRQWLFSSTWHFLISLIPPFIIVLYWAINFNSRDNYKVMLLYFGLVLYKQKHKIHPDSSQDSMYLKNRCLNYGWKQMVASTGVVKDSLEDRWLPKVHTRIMLSPLLNRLFRILCCFKNVQNFFDQRQKWEKK